MAEQVIDPLLAELRNVMEQADPVPDHVLATAKAVFTWRTIDAELAELVADSASERALVTTRGSTSPPRLLTFEASGLTVEVEVAETGGTRRLVGQLIPTAAAQVVIRWATGSHELRSDELGRFVCEGMPGGPISMTVTSAGATTPVVTSWVTI